MRHAQGPRRAVVLLVMRLLNRNESLEFRMDAGGAHGCDREPALG